MKMRKKTSIILIFLLVFSIGCKNKTKKKNQVNLNQRIEKIEEIERDTILEEVNNMSLNEKLGQLIIVGFEGKDINEESQDYIENLKVGGFILFSRNIENKNQTLKLLNDLKKTNKNNKFPLFLSVDEEGGSVSRLSNVFLEMPDAMTIGNKNDIKLSYELGIVLGAQLDSLGFNMNFAPVLDINSNPKNPVIGKRAFGTSPEIVSDNGIEVIKGLRSMNIIPTAKHFPGHGDTEIDSHIKLPEIDKTIEELSKFELIPFNRAIEENIEMIMVAHILYPKIDGKYPATMSKEVIEGLLRGALNYEGVIVSDDMTMGAISENYTLEDSVLSFIEAGGDIALICHGSENPEKVINKLKEALSKGRISEKELDEKVYRILKLKKI